MNLIDFLLLFIWLGIIFLGFSVGIIKMGCALIGMYIGVNIAALVYQPFASLTVKPGADPSVGYVVWFGVAWIVSSIVFTLIALSFLGPLELPRWMKGFEQLAGLASGLVVGIFGLLVFGFVIQNTLALALASSQCQGGFVKFFAQNFTDSLLMHIFGAVKDVLINALSPFLKNGSSAIPVFQDNSAQVRSCGLS